jgi:hypothetical protein
MVTDLAEPDKWVTNPATNFATLGMFVDPALRGARAVGLKGNPELIATAAQHDVPLGLGEATGIPALSRASVALERVPLVGTSAAMKIGSSKAAAAADRLLGRFTPGDTADVPDQIQASMIKTLQQNKSEVKAVESKIKNITEIQQVAPIPMDNVWMRSAELLDEFPDIFDRLPSTSMKDAITKIAEGSLSTKLKFTEAMRFRSMLNNYISRAYKSTGQVGSAETYQLTALKRALDQDINTWGATTSNQELVNLMRERNSKYIEKVVPFKDAIVKKSTGLEFDTDTLMQNFVRPDRPNLAGKLMNSLDPEGQQLVRYQVLKKAVDAGHETMPGVPFSPAKFAAELERLGPTLDAIYGADAKLVRGFAKLMRATQRYGQFAENQSNGSRMADWTIGGAFTAGMMTAPGKTLTAAATMKLMSSMLTQPWGRKLLLRASSMSNNSSRWQSIFKEVQSRSSYTPLTEFELTIGTQGR